MKNFTLTLCLIFSVLLVQAYPQGSELVIHSKTNSLIRVSLDRGPLSAPSSSVRLAHLQPGNHWIKVVKHRPGFSYGSSRIVYKGPIHIAPRSKTRAVVNRYGKFNIQAVKPLFAGTQFCGHNACIMNQGHSGSCYHPLNFHTQIGNTFCGINGCGLGQGHAGMHGNHQGFGICGTGYNSQGFNGYNGYTGYSNNYYNNWGNSGFGHQCMTDGQFKTFKQTLRNQNFESTKMQVARQVIGQNYFTTDQVREIVRMFHFESKRLDLAKYAYARTIDKENYYTLSNTLSFTSSINDLMRFIGNG